MPTDLRLSTHLSERCRVDLVLGSNLHADSRAGLGIVRSLDAGFGRSVNAVVVARSQHAQVVTSSDGARI
jgi:hypothetical protein